MIEFHDRALSELRQAQSWYRTRSLQVAERFFNQVTQAIERLVRDPASHSIAIRQFRYARVRRFPFILVYQIRGDNDVFVIAVAHTSRRPGYWSRRK